MKKNFAKSLSAAILGLSLTANCSILKNQESHKCASKDSSVKKTDEAHKCAGKKAKKERRAKKTDATTSASAPSAEASTATPKKAAKK